MENYYIIHWNTGEEVIQYRRICTYEDLKKYITNCKFHNPNFVVEAVEEVIESRTKIDIDGEV